MDHVKRDEKNVNIVVYLFIYFYNKRVQWISFKDLKDLNLKSSIICQSKIRDTVKILVARLIDTSWYSPNKISRIHIPLSQLP